jgi:hypothetical protein
MKTNRLSISVLAMTISLAVGAQTSFDAAKLYEEELNGTARYVGMGGAMSALGSDPSVISHNPAGIGTYRKSDLNFSVSFFGTSMNTDPVATKLSPISSNGRTYYTKDNRSDVNVAFDNFSAVFSGSDSGDNYLNFGISYRKLQNLDRSLNYIDKFFVPDAGDPSKQYVVYREFLDNQRNKINSFDFNLSCNLSDMVYFGWTVGILSTDTWSEGYFYDYYPTYGAAEFEDKAYVVPAYADDGHDYTAVDKMNQSEGSGWNMAFGTIIRPLPALRLGAAIKTPTYFKQTLEYADYLYAIMDTPKDGSKFSSAVDYSYSSPWSLNLSAGLTFGKTAIGAEYEKHFTQRSSLSIGNTKMVDQGAIDYKDYSTIKVGLEQNISNLSLRLGYNLIESMFKDNAAPWLGDSDFNGWKYDGNGNVTEVGRTDFQVDRLGKTQYMTAGLGYCSAPDADGTQFYVDLAYLHGIRNSTVNVNEYIEDVDVNYNYKTDKVLLTIGWSF